MSSSVHIDNKNKDILILREGPTQELNDTTLTAKTKYLNFTQSGKRFVSKNESKIVTKDISRECKCKLDGRKCNSNQKWNNDRCRCECKKYMYEKYYISNPSTCSCKNRKYLASI